MKNEKNWQERAAAIIGHDKFGDLWERPIFPHRVLLWSEATGTGKSTLPLTLLESRRPVRVTLFREMEVDSLVGPMQLRDGSTVCEPQLAALAMRDGRPLIIDEVDQYSASVETYLNALLDDVSLAQLTLPDGSTIQPANGYCVVGTTNARPDSLPERLLHRFDAIIHADSPCESLIESLPGAIAKLLVNSAKTEKSFFAPMTSRRAIALDRFKRAGYSERESIELVFGTDPNTVDAMLAALAANSVE